MQKQSTPGKYGPPTREDYCPFRVELLKNIKGFYSGGRTQTAESPTIRNHRNFGYFEEVQRQWFL